MTELEIFDKLKDALDNQYIYSNDYFEPKKEIDNLEDYLNVIKQERILEQDHTESTNKLLNTYIEFIKYLAGESVGCTAEIITAVSDSMYIDFSGYVNVTKEVANNKLYLCFQIDDVKYRALWHPSCNYAVWQTCEIAGDDYSGYLLFPTRNENKYFCLYYYQ